MGDDTTIQQNNIVNVLNLLKKPS